LTKAFVEIYDDVREALLFLGGHFLALHILELDCGQLLLVGVEVGFEFRDLLDNVAFGIYYFLESVLKRLFGVVFIEFGLLFCLLVGLRFGIKLMGSWKMTLPLILHFCF
jgi:hypothetical protein